MPVDTGLEVFFLALSPMHDICIAQQEQPIFARQAAKSLEASTTDSRQQLVPCPDNVIIRQRLPYNRTHTVAENAGCNRPELSFQDPPPCVLPRNRQYAEHRCGEKPQHTAGHRVRKALHQGQKQYYVSLSATFRRSFSIKRLQTSCCSPSNESQK